MKFNLKSIKNNQKLLVGLVLLSILVITLGITYAFFSYTKQGTKDNVIQTGTITFLYTEIDKVGAGIEIEDALPMADSLGKVQTGDNKVFNFKINADTTSTTAINYEITAKKSDDSTLDDSVVKLYLTKVEDTTEEELLLNTFDKLDLPTKEGLDTNVEKLIYKGKVPSNTPNYEQNFRLRMWIDEKTDFSGIEQEDGSMVYPYNDKSFKINVNVYADGNVLTQEDIDLESSADYTSVLVNEEELTKLEDETLDYQYEIDLQNVDSTTIIVNTKSEYAKVEIEKLDSLENTAVLEVPNVKRLSTSKVLDLISGENYFKIIITSEDGTIKNSFVIKIYVDSVYNFDYIDEAEGTQEQIFLVPVSGYYKLETWGAQGGNISTNYTGGYGAYSVGTVYLNENEKIFVNVGGTGNTSATNNKIVTGGYNGGGVGVTYFGTQSNIRQASGGGGATHISKVSGLLSELEQYKGELNSDGTTYDSDTILIVSGGGSGTWYFSAHASTYYIKTVGHAGGYVGSSGIGYIEGTLKSASGGTQTGSGIEGLYFGTFGSGVTSDQMPSSPGGTAGSGGGYYGGNINSLGAGGGSSYIGSSLLTDKVMYCYDCDDTTVEAKKEATKTISTTNVSETPIANYAKIGNGYARITYIGQ